MQQKLRTLLVFGQILLLLFSFTAKALASDEISAFGYSDERNRVVKEKVFPKLMPWGWYWNTGKSYSQPLVLSGSRFGRENPVVISMAGNYLWGFESLSREEMNNLRSIRPNPPMTEFNPSQNKSLVIPGGYGEPVGSHTTFFNYQGKLDILVSGAKDGNLYIHSKDGKNIFEFPLGGSAIVSAPLVVEYQGFPIIIAGNGDGGDVVLITNLHLSSPSVHRIPLGGRISSSAAPIDNKGFIIGKDGGTGEVRGYLFSKIFKVVQIEREIRGKKELVDQLEIVSSPQASWSVSTASGVPASFAVDGFYVYFSDKLGNFYKVNKLTGALIWKNGFDVAAGGKSFVNRSPAVDDQKVYFSVQNYKGTNKGTVVALDKNTGKLVGIDDTFQSRVVTAPVVLKQANALAVGTEDGWMAFTHMYPGKTKWEHYGAAYKIFENEAFEERAKAGGFSGEISIAQGLLVAVGTSSNAQGGFLIAYPMSLMYPADLQAVAIDPGVPAGVEPKPGEYYNGKVTFKNAGQLDAVDAPISAFLDGVQFGLYANGVKVDKISLKAGESKEFTFKWQVPNKEQVQFVSKINIPPNPDIGEYIFANNTLFKDVFVDVDTTNVSVASITAPSLNAKDTNVPITVKIANTGTTDQNTKLVVKIKGTEVLNKNYALLAGTQIDVPISWKAGSLGSAVIEAEVNPAPRAFTETNYTDNRKTKTISVVAQPNLPVCNNRTGTWTVTYTGRDDVSCRHDDGNGGKLHDHDHVRRSKDVAYDESISIKSFEMTGVWRSIQERTTFDLTKGPGKILGGFYLTLKVVTEYKTDWESKVPKWDHGASPSGGTYAGPTRMQVQWSSGEVTELERTDVKIIKSGGDIIERLTWELPRIMTQTKGWQRWYYTRSGVKKGIYTHRIVTNKGGKTGICLTQNFGVEIVGSMEDLLKTQIVQ